MRAVATVPAFWSSQMAEKFQGVFRGSRYTQQSTQQWDRSLSIVCKREYICVFQEMSPCLH